MIDCTTDQRLGLESTAPHDFTHCRCSTLERIIVDRLLFWLSYCSPRRWMEKETRSIVLAIVNVLKKEYRSVSMLSLRWTKALVSDLGETCKSVFGIFGNEIPFICGVFSSCAELEFMSKWKERSCKNTRRHLCIEINLHMQIWIN